MRRRSLFVLAVSWSAAFLLAAGHRAHAASFNISTASTSAQSLGAGDTGVVTATGSLTLGGSTIPISVTGNSTITNSGQILQTGSARGIVVASGTLSLGITNNAGAVIQTADGDVLRITPTSTGGATLDNYGTLTSLNASAGGNQAVDWSNITSGSNVITNYSTGLIQAANADAVRPGVNGVVNNAGTIKSTTNNGSSSDGVDVQANSGISVVNAFNVQVGPIAGTGLIEGARHGITGGAASSTVTFTTSVTNYLGGTIQGDNGAGINLDGFNGLQSAVIINNGTITGNGVTGDGDGVDVDGLVTLTNTGIIRSINSFNLPASGVAFSEGITVGVGTIINSGTIEGLVAAGNTNAVGRGISLAGNDITTGPLAGTREAIYSNAIITNQAGGLIRGQSDSGIGVDGAANTSGYTVTINNNAGATIQGGGTANAAVRTGADNDTINNAGTIDGSSSGKAIDLAGGDDNLNITGGSAVITGSIDGGAGTNHLKLDLGLGNTFTYSSGTITNFASVEVKTGTTILDGANRISATTALNLNGGYLKIIDVGGADGQTFATLTLADNSILDLGNGTSLTFNGFDSYVAGKTLAVLEYDSGVSADWAIRFLGDLTGNADFLALMAETTVDGVAAQYSFSGGYTNVVPESSVFGIIVGGVSFLALRRRRRG